MVCGCSGCRDPMIGKDGSSCSLRLWVFDLSFSQASVKGLWDSQPGHNMQSAQLGSGLSFNSHIRVGSEEASLYETNQFRTLSSSSQAWCLYGF